MVALEKPFAQHSDIRIALAVDDSATALALADTLAAEIAFVPRDEADVLLVLGGDGFMLHVFREMAEGSDSQIPTPIYGMNTGSVGFLLNRRRTVDVKTHIKNAVAVHLHPLLAVAKTSAGEVVKSFAFNEFSLFRQSQQAAHINVIIDGQMRLCDMICDGLIISTPAGSTAYNFACNGPILPLGASVLALTPISIFRPRRWRGAILHNWAMIRVTVESKLKRPVSASADGVLISDVVEVDVREDKDNYLSVLFEPGESLDERIFKEQFMA